MEIEKYATINYLLNEKGRKDHILKGGNGMRFQSLNVEVNDTIINLAEISEYGEIEVNIGFDKNKNRKGEFRTIRTDYEFTYGCDNISAVWSLIEFDTVMESQELIEFEAKRIKELKIKEEKMLIEVEEKKKLKEERKAEADRIRKEQERVQEKKYIEAQKEREEAYIKKRDEEEKQIREWEKERDLWIKENGSNYLKDAIDLGYKIDNIYIKERANKELAQFEVDFNDYLYYEKIEEPSETAIREVKRYIELGYEAQIVTIMCGIDGMECEEEGIVIPKYLNRYCLVRMV